MKRGKFIVLEGGEGVGKTTQAHLLIEKLNKSGHETEFIREPGADYLAEKLRELLLNPDVYHEPETELLLFNAARVQTLLTVKERLDHGINVVSDRNMLSTIAYQGYGRGLDLKIVQEICEFATRRVHPDLIILLDAPAEIVNTRRKHRGTSDRFEAAGEDFHERVRDGYRKEATRLNLPIIDASPAVDDVFKQIWQKVEPLIN